MIKKVFVGNLPWSVRTAELSQLLSDLEISFRSAKVVEDRETGQSRGFGFIEVDGEGEMQHAIFVLHGYIVEGRPLNANEAKPKGRSSGGSPGGSRGGSTGSEGNGGSRGSGSGGGGGGGGGGGRKHNPWDEEDGRRQDRRDRTSRNRQAW